MTPTPSNLLVRLFVVIFLLCQSVFPFTYPNICRSKSFKLFDYIRRSKNSKPRTSRPPRKFIESIKPTIVDKTDDVPGDVNSNAADKREYIDAGNYVKPKKNINFSVQTILGQNIINCRDFSPEGPKTFSFEGSYESIKEAPIFGFPEVAFIGRSNVGKSSLLNMLSGLNKNIAIVSKTPGRTRQINMFRCKDRDGDFCVLVDLPGYGFAKMSKSDQEKISEFLRDYLSNRGPLRLVVLLVDARRELQKSDQEIVQFLRDNELEFMVVATKSDKCSKHELEVSLRQLRQGLDLDDDQPIPVSSVQGLGKKEIWKGIRRGILSLSNGQNYGDDSDRDEDDDDDFDEDGDDDDFNDDDFDGVDR